MFHSNLLNAAILFVIMEKQRMGPERNVEMSESGEYSLEQEYVITRRNGIVLSSEAEGEEVVRKISSREELEELIERMPYIQTIQAPNSKIRKELYQTAMEQFEDIEWVRIIKSVYLRMEEKHYESYEQDFAERAKGFLYREIAIRFEVPFDEVEQFLNKTIEKQLREF